MVNIIKIREVEQFIRTAGRPVSTYEVLQGLEGKGVKFDNRKVIHQILTKLKKRGVVAQTPTKEYYIVVVDTNRKVVSGSGSGVAGEDLEMLRFMQGFFDMVADHVVENQKALDYIMANEKMFEKVKNRCQV